MGGTGPEQSRDLPGLGGILRDGGTESGTPGATIDSELAELVRLWKTLPADVQRMVMEMVRVRVKAQPT